METNDLGDAVLRAGIICYAREIDLLRYLNAHKDNIEVSLEWLIKEAYRQLEGLEHATIGRASDEIVLKEAADVGNLCQIIYERVVGLSGRHIKETADK